MRCGKAGACWATGPLRSRLSTAPHSEPVKESVGRRKRLPHKTADPRGPRCDRRFRLSGSGILLSLVLAFGLLAQPVKITVNTQLVVETVSVTDKNGKASCRERV